MNNCVLVWLNWPEACFCADAESIKYLKGLLPEGTALHCVRSEAAFLRNLPKATHAIVWHFRPEWYEKAKNLKVLATPGAGRELIAWEQAPKGVKVHFGGFHGAIIAESVAAFCLAWARGFFRTPPKTGLWPRTWLSDKCFTVAGTRAVIAGYGRIGKAVGDKLSLLGVEVKGFGRKNLGDLPAAASKADWFIMALPGDTGTDNFLDAKLLHRLPKRCVIVNVGRGNAIDEPMLRESLATGRIAAAYLDVFKNEPTIINPKAMSKGGAGSAMPPTKNLIAMPHSSAFAPQYLRMAFKELKDEGLI